MEEILQFIMCVVATVEKQHQCFTIHKNKVRHAKEEGSPTLRSQALRHTMGECFI
jgi:hypothetical protein